MSAIPALSEVVTTDLEAFLAFADARPPDERWELIDGRPVMMTTPTEAHDIICQNLSDALSPPLRAKSCRLHRSALVRRADRTDFGAIPDVMIRCGDVDPARRVYTDPWIVIEVLSPSTRGYDRGTKLRHYTAIDTLRHIVLVYDNERRIEHWARSAGLDWPDLPEILTRETDVLRLDAIAMSVPVAAIYDGLRPA